MLRTSELTKRFGGLIAVDAVNFRLDDELCSLIGPNGAGKTTFFNLLTSELTASAGRIEFRTDDGWTDITDATPYETASLGIHRSYQVTNIFPTVPVIENVGVAAQAHHADSWKIWRNVNTFADYFDEAQRPLDRVGLAGSAESLAMNLSHGEKRQLEIGIALAGDPDVLLLDEPSAGISSESLTDVVGILEDVAADHAVLLIEHNMGIVMDIFQPDRRPQPGLGHRRRRPGRRQARPVGSGSVPRWVRVRRRPRTAPGRRCSIAVATMTVLATASPDYPRVPP